MTDKELRHAIIKELGALLTGHENHGMPLSPMGRDQWAEALVNLHGGFLRVSGLALDTLWEAKDHPERFDPTWLGMEDEAVAHLTIPNMRKAYTAIVRLHS